MAETEPKRTAKKAAAEKGRWSRPKDAHNTESQASYYARKYMESQAANTNTKVQFEIDEIPKKIEAAVKAKTRSEAILHGIQNKQERYFDLPAEILQQVLDPLVEEAKLANENWNTCVERIADLRRELAERKKRLPELVQKCQRAQAAFAEASKDRKELLGACKNLKARLRAMCGMWHLEMPPLDAPVTH